MARFSGCNSVSADPLLISGGFRVTCRQNTPYKVDVPLHGLFFRNDPRCLDPRGGQYSHPPTCAYSISQECRAVAIAVDAPQQVSRFRACGSPPVTVLRHAGRLLGACPRQNGALPLRAVRCQPRTCGLVVYLHRVSGSRSCVVEAPTKNALSTESSFTCFAFRQLNGSIEDPDNKALL